MTAEYVQVKAEISRREFEKSTNLLHNLVKLNALELQELYALMPQEELAGSFKDQTVLVADIVRREPREAAGVLLRLLKNSVSVKNEFAVYQMLYNESPKLSVAAHYVHKVIFNVVHLFYQLMIERRLEIRIGASADRLLLDYVSFQVALYHLMDNAVKYAEPDSLIEFAFERGDFGVRINISMESLAVDPGEEELIFTSGKSGRFATLTKTAGEGRGMGIARDLLKLNHAGLKTVFGKARPPTARLAPKDIQFARNLFVIEFPPRTVVKSSPTVSSPITKSSHIRPSWRG
ncbi:ATP-binding protein [Variovorax sp. LT1P1]|uniref:ATP-binding protein n=1 Tax=Variovorax sp. LT1P1 TaxID=3443730 RepID=UPI003F46F121